jgi:hypothetical protein
MNVSPWSPGAAHAAAAAVPLLAARSREMCQIAAHGLGPCCHCTSSGIVQGEVSTLTISSGIVLGEVSTLTISSGIVLGEVTTLGWLIPGLAHRSQVTRLMSEIETELGTAAKNWHGQVKNARPRHPPPVNPRLLI